MKELEIEQLFKEGVKAVRSGDKQLARAKLEAVILRDEFHEQAWLWLSAAVTDRKELIVCLQNVLTINPESKPARQGLKKLGINPEEMLPPRRPSDRPPPERPQPTKAPTPTLTHTAPDAVGDELHALVTGAPPPKPDRSDLPPEESWRAALYDEDYVSEASIVGSKQVEIPDLSLNDLFNVWIDLLLLHPHGGLQDEVNYGGIGHIGINVIAASFLTIAAVLITFVMVFALPARGFRPPLITSTTQWVAQAPDAPIPEENPNTSATLLLIDTLGLPNPVTIGEEMTATAQSGLEQRIANVLASPFTMLLLYAVIIFPAVFVGLFYYSVFTNVSANMYGGKGSVAQTLHALSLAIVAIQLTQVPAAIITPLLPLGFAMMVGFLLTVYQLIIAGVAYGKVHRLDTRSAVGLMLMGLVFGNIAAGGLCGVLSWIVSSIV